jgi:hypothetical protein
LAGVVALWVWCASTAAQDVEKHDCDTTLGWFGQGELSAQEGVLVYRPRAEGPPQPLFRAALLTDLRRLTLRVRPGEDRLLLFVVEDRDGARFHAARGVSKSIWQSIVLTPPDFRLAKGSPVLKQALDPSRLGFGFALVSPPDKRPPADPDHRIVLEIDSLEIERSDLPVRQGVLEVREALTLERSHIHTGDIRVSRGATLKITAPRLVLRGDLQVTGGSVVVEGGVLVVDQRFNHERKITADGDARLRFAKAGLFTRFPLQVSVKGGSVFAMEKVQVAGGITCSPEAGTMVAMHAVEGAGEFVLGPGVTFGATESKRFLVWLVLGPNLRGKLEFPDGAKVRDWSAGHGFKVRVKGCTEVMWGVVSVAGAHGTVAASRLRAAGFFFGGDAAVAIEGKDLARRAIAGPDRTLEFGETVVETWNFYTNERAHLTLSDCTFGEAIAFGHSRIDVVDSTCDGRGGYLRADANATLHMMGCTIACRVVARDSARIILENCRVRGDIHAVGRSEVRLVKTRVEGNVQEGPHARVVRE